MSENRAVAKADRAASPAMRTIMSTAAGLFADRGYGSVGISEVGSASGFGKGSLYYHIRSKEDLLFAIMTNYMIELNSAATEIVEAEAALEPRVRQLTASFVRTMFDNRAEMTVCFREVHSLGDELQGDVLKLHGDYQQIWERTFLEAAEAGEGRAVSKVETKAILGMFFYSFLWVRTDGPAGPDEIAADFARIVLDTVSLARSGN